MNQFSKEQVQRLAKDLMLSLTDDEMEIVLKDSAIFMAQLEALQAVDTESVEMMSYPFENDTTWLREDVVSHVISQETAFKNAPHTEGDYVEIVRVVDK